MKKKSLLILGLLVFGFSLSLSAQTINATQTDEIIIDNGTSGKADPADRIRYKVTIQNTAGPAGTNTQLNIVPDPRTSFVAGTFRSSPLAINDAYACTGNVSLDVPAASGLKANDFDDNIGGLTVTAGTFATTGGGSIMIAADGSFMYSPPPGLTGGSTDTYTYTLNDGNAVSGVTATDMAVVTFTLNNLIWFVNNTGGGSGGNGTLSTPFKTLGDFNSGSAAAGDVIYIEETGTNYTGGIVLQNNEDLYGEGHSGGANLADVLPFGLATHSKPLPAINGNNPVILNTGGTAIALASGNTLRGLDIGSSGTPQNGTGLSGTGVGALTIDELSVFVGGASAGKGINLDGGGPIDIEMVQMNLVSCNPIAIDVNNISSGTWLMSGTTDISNASTICMDITNTTANFTFPTLNITNGGNHGLNLGTCGGNFTINGGTITNPGGTGVLISGGSVVFSSSGVITDNSGFAVDVDNHDSGNATFSGNITSTGTGIRVQNCGGGTKTFSGSSKSLTTTTNTAVTLSSNTGATINFTNGGLAITTTSGTGFNATGGGTVTVEGAGNTINSGTGTALNVANTTIGGSDLNFVSISSSGGSAPGISLDNTGASGGLIVNGDGTNTSVGGNSSGGTISGKDDLGTNGSGNLGTGINLNNTRDVILRRMTINGTNQNFGIRGNSVTNFTLEYSTVSGTNGDDPGTDEGSVNFDNLLGSAAITNCSIDGGSEDNLNVVNTSGTLNRLTISGSTFGFNNTTTGNNNILLEAQNAGTTLNFTIQSSTIKGARADWINASNNSSSTMDAVIGGAGSLTNSFDNLGANAHPGAAAGGNRVVLGSTGTLTFDINNNTLKGSKGEAIRVRTTGTAGGLTGTGIGHVRNNVVGVPATANSGSSESFGIFAFGDGGSDMTISITGNQVHQYNNHGISCTFGDEINDGSSFHVTVTTNTVNTPGTINNDFNGFHLNNGSVGATDNFLTCLHLSGNNLVGSGKGSTPPNNQEFRLRQRQSTTVRLPGYAGANNNDAAVVTFLQGQNTVSGGNGAASNTVPTGGGFIGGAACN